MNLPSPVPTYVAARGPSAALVAVDPDGNELFVSGKTVKIANVKTRKNRRRLNIKLAAHKAEGKNTRGVRRSLKRLGRKQRNRTTTFCQTTAKTLIQWVPANAVVVLENLTIPQPSKTMRQRAGVRRRMSQWQFGQMRTAIEGKAAERGIAVALVNPAYTSQDCSRCGLRGDRQKHRFSCPHCGFAGHADINAATNIRDRFTLLRGSGPLSIGPEARSCSQDAGKLSALADSH